MRLTKILCLGDSNTWGYIPNSGGRYPESVRWPSLLRQGLGEGYRVHADGQPGRTTIYPQVAANTGSAVLPDLLQQHSPELLVTALGTNDLMAQFGQGIDQVKAGIAQLVQLARAHPNSPSKILLLAPPPLQEVGEFGRLFVGAAKKSQGFASVYAELAQALACDCIDLAELIAEPCVDGIHWSAEQHQRVAAKLVEYIQAL